MAFIVQMTNYGRPHIFYKWETNEEGESYIVDEIITGEPDPNYAHLSCSGSKWYKAIELGKQYGWLPKGTVYDHNNGVTFEILGDPGQPRRDYEPDDYNKVVLDDDASEWADALEKALPFINEEGVSSEPILITSSMNNEQFKKINLNSFTEFLKEFIVLLRKGKFKFIWDN